MYITIFTIQWIKSTFSIVLNNFNFTSRNKNIFIFIIFELLCVVLILLISPLDTENNPLTGQEKKMYRMLTSIITILIFIISSLCFFKGYRNIGSSMICGVVMSALVLLMRKIQIINMRIKK